MQIPQLTFLRFIAAFGVVLFHFGQTTAPFSAPWLLPIVQHAGLGVGFFFTLSGFLMAWVYADKSQMDYRRYAQTRFARIYPLYLFSFLLALAAEMGIRGTRPRGLSIILQALGLQAWIPGYSLALNFPGWSVSVEIFFYLVFPWLLSLLKHRGRIWQIGMSLWLWVLSLLILVKIADWTAGIVPNENSDFTLRFPPWHLHSFFMGMVGGLWYREGKLSLPGKWLPAVLFLLLSVGMLSLAYFPNLATAYAANGLFAPIYLGLIIAIAQDKSWLSKLLSWQPLQFAGEMSYAIYLLQAPIYIALEPIAQHAGATGLVGTWLGIYLGILLLTSGLTYQFFERPMRNWLRP